MDDVIDVMCDVIDVMMMVMMMMVMVMMMMLMIVMMMMMMVVMTMMMMMIAHTHTHAHAPRFLPSPPPRAIAWFRTSRKTSASRCSRYDYYNDITMIL